MIDIVGQEIQKFGQLIEWPYVFLFLMIAYLVNKLVKSKKYLPQVQPKLPTFVRSLIVGAGLGLIFYFLGELSLDRVYRLFVSLVFTMFVMWDGLKYWLDIVPNIGKKFVELFKK